MDIFNYHPITNEYLSTEVAELDPLEGQPLIPAHATSVTVISVSAGNVPVFNGTTWDEVEDNRGTVYDTSTGIAEEFTQLGTLTAGLTTLVHTEYSSWDGNSWVEDLSAIRTNQKSIITNSFNTALSVGFTTTSTIKMDATYDDVMRLDAGVRLAEALSQTNMDIRDFDNVTHNVSTTAAKTMVNEIGTNYQTILQQKWTKCDEIDLASTRANIELVV